ncbi:MAG: hypothetical protein CRN43_04860 [Candidatus Nephrothrix sp. EaCA]|nr:MAG: hypothetical protein CRN43_04860 [Candidatus Nephrothrix sp. EaCA]
MTLSKKQTGNLTVLRIENDHLSIEIMPALGGKISSIYNKKLNKEFLWKNENLPVKKCKPGDCYDDNFLGGFDELIPNDLPENTDGIDYPDHGELWTASLDYSLDDETAAVFGTLKLSQLFYRKTISLEARSPTVKIQYSIKNLSDERRHFLWKLHAALNIEAGCKLETAAGKAKVADLEYSRYRTTEAFEWPRIEGMDASIVPDKNKSVDFFYLYDIAKPEMTLANNKENVAFRIEYDDRVFPFQWYFASYGGFLNHYVAILEPCTNMPMSVNEAKAINQSATLQPGEELNTTVRIYAGAHKTL